MSEPVTEQPAEVPEQPAQAAEIDWKAEARKWESRAKENGQKLKEAETSKTELQRQQEETTRWQNEATTWRTQAVSSRVETLASADFADPSDALSGIGDPGKYLDAGGQINEDAIKADLAALLERKPHWRRADPGPSGSRVPAPNPAQGSGANGAASSDPREQFGALIQGLMKKA